jgi:hypothetical protein
MWPPNILGRNDRDMFTGRAWAASLGCSAILLDREQGEEIAKTPSTAHFLIIKKMAGIQTL